MSQALELHRLSCPHRSVLRDCGGIWWAWGRGTQRWGVGKERTDVRRGAGDLPQDKGD